MKIAITGGTGFVGGTLTRALLNRAHQVILIARGMDQRFQALQGQPGVSVVLTGTQNEERLFQSMEGCEALVHCAGINREIGSQTYQSVHIDGTRKVVAAAIKAGIKKLVLVSYLRARPNTGSPYHESKWAAEEIVRACGLSYTILKPGMMFGKGDHMLDHISHALRTFPLFASVGFQEKMVRPVAVEDVIAILISALETDRLSNRTVYVAGPEAMVLSEAVKRVGKVIGRRPFIFPLPVWFHFMLGWIFEHIMKVPLVSLAQVHMLSESADWEGWPVTHLPDDLVPQTMFTAEQIQSGLHMSTTH